MRADAGRIPSGLPRNIAFLRGINLRRRRVKMDRLAEVFAASPASDVGTSIASGNVGLPTSTMRNRRMLLKLAVIAAPPA